MANFIISYQSPTWTSTLAWTCTLT